MGTIEASNKSFSNQKYYPYLFIVVFICLIIIVLQIILLLEVEQNHTSVRSHFHADIIIVTIVILTLLLGVGLAWMIRSRKITVEALHSKSDELERYFENSIDMLCIADTKGFFRHLNPEWSRVLGYNLSELEGKPFIEFVHPDDVAQTIEVTAQLADNQKIQSFINRYRHVDGTYRWIEWRSFPVGDLIYASARDITERKRTEQELQENIDRAQAFSDATNEGIVVSDNGIVIEANKQSLKILGFNDFSEIVGKSILEELTPPESKEVVMQHIHNNNAELYESTSYRKDKSIIPIELRGRAIMLKGKKMRVTTVRDLTDQKRAEQEMRETDLWLRDSQRNSHIGSYNYDIIADRWKSSDELNTIFGISSDFDKNSVGWLKLIHPDHQQEMAHHLLEYVIKQHNTFDKEYRIIRQNDGEIRWVHGLGNLYFDSEGNAIQMIGTIADITDRRKSEEVIRQSEQKYRLLFENMTSGFALHQMIYDEQGAPADYRYIEANPAFYKLTGLPREGTIGRTIKEMLPNIEDYWIQSFGHVAISGEPMYYMNYVEGLSKYYETYVFCPEKNTFAVMFNDVTDRIRAEEELKASEKKFADIFNLSPNVVGILRCSDRKLIDANPAYTELTGYVKDENIDNSSTEVNIWVYPEERERMFIELKEKGQLTNFEMNLRSKDGSMHMCLFSVKGITYNNEECLIFIIHDITRLKEAENALRLSEQKFSNIYNLSPDMVGISRLSDGKILDGNPAMTRLTGYCYDEYIGKSTLGLGLWANPEDRNVALATLKEKGEIKNFEIGMRIKDGTVLTCLFSATTLTYLNEPCLLFVVNDITERKKVEFALIESESKARLFIEHTPLPIAMFDSDMRYMMASKRWSIDYKLGEQPLIGRSHYEVFPEIGDAWKDDHKRVLAGEIYKNDADRFERDDGSIQWLRYELHPWRKNDGQIGGLVMFTEDITERKTAEEELANTYEMLKVTLETIPVALFDLDTKGYVKSIWNPAAEQLLGYTKDEAIGKYLPTVSQEKREEFSRFLATIQEGKIIQGSDVERKKKNGEPISYSIYAAPLYNREKKIIGNIAALVDITERKMMILEMQALNETLEKKVLERTGQLQQSNKDLESFAYSVSHDLRAPLRHIDGFLRLMYSKMENPNPQITNYFDKIEASSKRMSTMIDDLLTFSRLGRRELVSSSVDLNIVVKEIVEQLKPDTGNRIINWNISKLPKIKGDKNLLKLAFENLIANSIKYTSKKQEATIEIGVSDVAHDYLELFVKDNGVGFDMAYVDKLFGVFQRLHSSEEFEGTGVGLANVKQIVLKHKGSIRAEGKLNEGAIFYLTLPK